MIWIKSGWPLACRFELDLKNSLLSISNCLNSDEVKCSDSCFESDPMSDLYFAVWRMRTTAHGVDYGKLERAPQAFCDRVTNA